VLREHVKTLDDAWRLPTLYARFSSDASIRSAARPWRRRHPSRAPTATSTPINVSMPPRGRRERGPGRQFSVGCAQKATDADVGRTRKGDARCVVCDEAREAYLRVADDGRHHQP